MSLSTPFGALTLAFFRGAMESDKQAIRQAALRRMTGLADVASPVYRAWQRADRSPVPSIGSLQKLRSSFSLDMEASQQESQEAEEVCAGLPSSLADMTEPSLPKDEKVVVPEPSLPKDGMVEEGPGHVDVTEPSLPKDEKVVVPEPSLPKDGMVEEDPGHVDVTEPSVPKDEKVEEASGQRKQLPPKRKGEEVADSDVFAESEPEDEQPAKLKTFKKPKGMKRPAAKREHDDQPADDLVEAESSRGGGADAGAGDDVSDMYPNAEKTYKDTTGEWQVFEWTRKNGKHVGDTWRKIVHISSRKVYPSFNAAEKHGFDRKNLVKDVD